MDPVDLNFNPNGMMMTVDPEKGIITKVSMGGSAHTAGVTKNMVVYAIRREFTPEIFDQICGSGERCEVIVQHTNNVKKGWDKSDIKNLFVKNETPGVEGVFKGTMKHLAFEEKIELTMDTDAVADDAMDGMNDLLKMGMEGGVDDFEPKATVIDFNSKLWLTHLGKAYFKLHAVGDSVTVTCAIEDPATMTDMILKLRFPLPKAGHSLTELKTLEGEVFVNDVPGGKFEFNQDPHAALKPNQDDDLDEDVKKLTEAWAKDMNAKLGDEQGEGEAIEMTNVGYVSADKRRPPYNDVDEVESPIETSRLDKLGSQIYEEAKE